MTDGNFEEQLKRRRAFQVNVLQRFMTKEQLQAMLESYRANTQGGGNKNRFEYLDRPLLRTDKVLLHRYLFDKEKTLREVAKEIGIHHNFLVNKARTLSSRVLYQNRDKFNLEEILKGGE